MVDKPTSVHTSVCGHECMYLLLIKTVDILESMMNMRSRLSYYQYPALHPLHTPLAHCYSDLPVHRELGLSEHDSINESMDGQKWWHCLALDIHWRKLPI